MTEKEKIHSGNLYFPNGEEILSEQLAYLDLMDEYNRTPRRLQAERAEMLKKLFALLSNFNVVPTGAKRSIAVVFLFAFNAIFASVIN